MDRLHIGIFGKTNVGKSSFLNKISSQDISIVSEIAGTTTDIVEKNIEFSPFGAVKFFDTAGFDDKSVLGEKRINKTLDVLNRINIGILLCDFEGLNNSDKTIITNFQKLNIPFITIINKTDIKKISSSKLEEIKTNCPNYIEISATSESDIITPFKKELLKILPEEFINPPKIVGDLIAEKSTVLLVVPIDSAAPKGRLILPQVQTIRDLLDSNCTCIIAKETEISQTIKNLKSPPELVITDSQVFNEVNKIVDRNIALTSFSILFARLKGDLKTFAQGAKSIDTLKNNDKILILESCTHHATDDDIGTVKIPRLLQKRTQKELIFEKYSGHDLPNNVNDYKLVIHCGACMTNRKEVLNRILYFKSKNIPITNYGMVISYCLGIFERAVEIFDL